MSSILIDPIRAAIFAAAHLMGGSLGAAILGVSFVLRLALVPLTLRLARRAADQQRILRALKPELTRLNKRHARNPDALWRETQALYARAGYRPLHLPSLLGNLARLPILGGIYGALRSLRDLGAFAWIPDLARPNPVLALVVAAGSGATAWLGSHAAASAGRPAALAAAAAFALSAAFFWHFSSALVLSWGASTVVDVVQGAALLRERRRSETAVQVRAVG